MKQIKKPMYQNSRHKIHTSRAFTANSNATFISEGPTCKSKEGKKRKGRKLEILRGLNFV